MVTTLHEGARPPRFYIPALDGLRFFAFLLVFIGHVPRTEPIFVNFQVMSWGGVDLFYLLSSFLLTRLAIDEFTATGTLRIKSFFVRRILRIWPLYFLALLIGFVLLPLIPVVPSYDESTNLWIAIPSALTFTLNLTSGLYDLKLGPILAPLWTICTEEQFYLIFPFVALAICRRKAILPWVVILSWVMTLGLRFFLSRQGEGDLIYLNLLTRLDPFLAGLVLGYVSTKNFKIFRNRLFQGVIMSVSAAILYFTHFWPHPQTPYSFQGNVLFYLTNTFAFSGILICVLDSSSILSRVLCFKPFVSLGKITYGLYVYHALVIALIMHYFGTRSTFSVMAISLPITAAVAALSYFFYEQRFLVLKQRYSIANKESPALAA